MVRMVWCSVVWVLCCGMVWYNLVYGTYGMVWCSMVYCGWCAVVRCGTMGFMVWCSVVWVVWCGVVSLLNSYLHFLLI